MFVESLDRAFENVCELDLVFHFDEVRAVPSETDISRLTYSLLEYIGASHSFRSHTRRTRARDERRRNSGFRYVTEIVLLSHTSTIPDPWVIISGNPAPLLCSSHSSPLLHRAHGTGFVAPSLLSSSSRVNCSIRMRAGPGAPKEKILFSELAEQRDSRSSSSKSICYSHLLKLSILLPYAPQPEPSFGGYMTSLAYLSIVPYSSPYE